MKHFVSDNFRIFNASVFAIFYSFCFFALFIFSIVCFNKRFIDIENDIDLPKNVHTKKKWNSREKEHQRMAFDFLFFGCLTAWITEIPKKDEEKRKITFAFYEKLQLDVKRLLVYLLERIFLFCMHFGRLC